MTSKVQAGPFKFIYQTQQIGEKPSKGVQWPKQDLIKYAAFINFSKDDISTQKEALSWSFLRKMSLFIQTKNPNQCRIFHKNMMETHITLDLLITDLRTKIQRFEQWYQAYETSLKNLKHCLQRETQVVDKQTTKIKAQVKEMPIKSFEINETYGEKMKQDLKPTDIDYPEDNIKPSNFQPYENQRKSTRPSFGFESFGETDSSKLINRNNDFDFFNKRTQSFLQPQKERPSNQDWMDCHNSFLNYLGMLKKVGLDHQ